MDTFATIVCSLLFGVLPGLAVLALFTIADHLRDIAEYLRNPSWHLTVEKPVDEEEDYEEEDYEEEDDE